MHACTINSAETALHDSGFLTLCVYRMVKSVSKLREGTFAEVFGCTTEMGETLAICSVLSSDFGCIPGILHMCKSSQLKGASCR